MGLGGGSLYGGKMNAKSFCKKSSGTAVAYGNKIGYSGHHASGRSLDGSLKTTKIPTRKSSVSFGEGHAASKKGYSASERPHHRAFSENNDISHVSPYSSSSETVSQFSRRTSGNNLTQVRLRRSNRVHLTMFIILAAVGICLAGVAAVLAYIGSIDSQFHDGLPSDIKTALTGSTATNATTYTLLVGKNARDTETSDEADTIMLVRTDPDTKLITIISLPRDTKVDVGGTTEHLYSVYTEGGATSLVSTVSTLAGVKISHYLEIDCDCLEGIIDSIGGVSVDVPANTGGSGVELTGGVQTLSGSDALVFARCEKPYTTGEYQRSINQRSLIRELLRGLFKCGFTQRVMLLSQVAPSITTDIDFNTLRTFFMTFRGMDVDANIYSAVIPSTVEAVDGISYVTVYDDEWSAMMGRVDTGLTPLASDSLTSGDVTITAASNIVPSDYSIDVRNGAGITGCASQAAAKLQAVGFVIGDVGNAARFVYDETLVIYNDSTDAAAAEVVAETLGTGRTVENDGSYTFSSTLLVVVGGDWQP